ncbi:penicillin-binding protein 2 [Candidatus Microgenomates bacterium]|nr:penicillin-binding protein 2 [Candidatus Microgenomates bacterium]
MSLFEPDWIGKNQRRPIFLNGKKTARAEDWVYTLLPNDPKHSGRIQEVFGRKPLLGLLAIIGLTISLLIYQLFNLQVVNGERMAGLANGNRLRQKVTYAQRGRILDRNGVELATNTASFQLVAYPYQLPKTETERSQLYQLLSEHVGLAVEEIKRRAEAKDLTYNQPLLIKDNMSYQQALILEQKLPSLSGVALDAVPTRHYKSDSSLAQILGYTGRASEEDLKAHPDLFLVDFVGKDGVEASYDSILRGQNGVVQTEVDASGRPIRTLAEQSTRPGQDITLTIDSGMQQVLAAAIAEYMPRAHAKRAAGVALNARSGEVLALVSLPSYDNNLFSQGISEEQYQKWLNDNLQPLHNKAIGGGYPSGSTIKPIHLAGALQEGVVNENTTIVDRGKIVVPSVYDPSVSYTFLGWNPAGLGPMNARRAIAMSSDIYFYTVGGGYQGFRGMGVERLTDWYRRFGLGAPTGIDLPGETAGRVPTPDWKKQTKGEDWFVGDTYNISIGQGDLLVSPLQLANGVAAIANGGKLLKPYVFKQTTNGQISKQPQATRENFVSPDNLKIVREGMRQVIGGTTSTATFANVGVAVAGKSGTAETDPNTKRRAHAWYTAFAPYDNPEIVMAVVLEEGEGGSQFAAPPIAKAMQYYFKNPRR